MLKTLTWSYPLPLPLPLPPPFPCLFPTKDARGTLIAEEIGNSDFATLNKSICRSPLEYSSPVWGPAISETNWDKLQIVQNQALKIVTGCHLMSNIDHLHQDTKVLPLKAHSEMLTTPPPSRNLSHHHTLLD